METENILSKYTISVIAQIILNYAFKGEKMCDYFVLGYYEKCCEIINEVESLNIYAKFKDDILNQLLYGACNGGNMGITKLLIWREYGANDWNYGLKGACRGGNIKIVKFMIRMGADNWGQGLYGACAGGHINVAKFMLEYRVEDRNMGLYGACVGGNIKMVKFMIENEASNWNRGLHNACKGGNMKIVKLMIEKGADDWIYGLKGACYGGNIKIVKFLINKCGDFATRLDAGITLGYACQGGNIKIINIIIEKCKNFIRGATLLPIHSFWNHGLNGAFLRGDVKIVRYIMEKRGNRPYHRYLYAACIGCNMELIKLVIEEYKKIISNHYKNKMII